MAFYLGNNKILDSEGFALSVLANETHSTFDSGEFQAQTGTWWSANPIYRTEGWSSDISIAVGGGIIAVGDSLYNDSNYTDVGRVDLFDNKGNWFRKLSLTADTYDTDANGRRFGDQVAIGNGVLAVTSYGFDSGSTNKVYLFDLSGNYQREFATGEADAVGFPTYITIGNERLVVSDPFWDSAGVTSSTEKWYREGRIHIFPLDDTSEKVVKYSDAYALGLTSRNENSTINPWPFFGNGLAAGYGRIYVGTPGDNADSGTNPLGNGVGSVFILDNDGNFLSKIDAYDAVYPPGPGGTGGREASFGSEINIGQGMVAIGAQTFNDGSTGAGGNQEGLVYVTNLNGEHLLSVGRRRPQEDGIADSSYENWDAEFGNDYGSNYQLRDLINIDNDRMYFQGHNPSTSNVGHLNVLKLDGAGAEATVDHADSAIRGAKWPFMMQASGGLWANADYEDEELNVQNSNLTLSGYLDKVLRKT
jgi:hypothetical protein